MPDSTDSGFPTIERVRTIVWRVDWREENFPGFTSIEILRQIQKDLNARQIRKNSFHVDVQRHWLDKEWKEVGDYANEVCFCVNIGHSLLLEMKKSGEERALTSQKENGNHKIELFAQRGHPVFRA